MSGKSTNGPEIAQERALMVRRDRGRASDADLGQAASASLKALIEPGTAVSDSAASALLVRGRCFSGCIGEGPQPRHDVTKDHQGEDCFDSRELADLCPYDRPL